MIQIYTEKSSFVLDKNMDDFLNELNGYKENNQKFIKLFDSYETKKEYIINIDYITMVSPFTPAPEY